MPRVCVLLAEGFEEIEAVTIIDVLRRGEVDVVILSVSGESVTGSHGIRIQADRTLRAESPETWDMVILPGGMPGSTNLRDHPGVRELIKKQHADGRCLAAICAAPIALGAAGVLEGKNATSYPGLEDQLPGATYREDRVVADGTVITSRGVGTSLDFALELVARLQGNDVAASLKDRMLIST